MSQPQRQPEPEQVAAESQGAPGTPDPSPAGQTELAEHVWYWEPLIDAIGRELAEHFDWRAETGTIQTYEHRETFRYLHIDSVTRTLYNQQCQAITLEAALKHALPRTLDAAVAPAAAGPSASGALPPAPGETSEAPALGSFTRAAEADAPGRDRSRASLVVEPPSLAAAARERQDAATPPTNPLERPSADLLPDLRRAGTFNEPLARAALGRPRRVLGALVARGRRLLPARVSPAGSAPQTDAGSQPEPQGRLGQVQADRAPGSAQGTTPDHAEPSLATFTRSTPGR